MRGGREEDHVMAEAEERCPFLVPLMADRLWMYPMPAYCRRPDAQVKVPAFSTILRLCASPAYLRCPGFVVSAGQGGRGQAPAP
jgi:hypothetical protein